MALGSRTAEVGSCRDSAAALLVVADMCTYFGLGLVCRVFFPRFGVPCFRERSRERCRTPEGCGLNVPRLQKLGVALPCLSNTGEEEVVLCAVLGSSEGR